MKRKIKFRAWDIINKEFKIIKELVINKNGEIYGIKVKDVVWILKLKTYGWQIILNQFIWILDKNWKEIYEGDILKIKWTLYYDYINGNDYEKKVERIVVVDNITNSEWFDSAKYIWTQTSYSSRTKRFFYWIKRFFPNVIEIIWNIYENPELLKR